jgi:uncharacterized membrane protein YfcA
MDFQIGLVIAGLTVVHSWSNWRWWWFIDDTNLIMVWYSTTAVGTDLLYAAFTKMGGIYVHHKKNINWTITAWLSLGSVPAATYLWILHTIKDITALNAIIKYSLGWALLLPRLLYKKQ